MKRIFGLIIVLATSFALGADNGEDVQKELKALDLTP